jgi:hypothetical protein
VFYGTGIDLKQLPGVTFGIMAAQRDAAGALTPRAETNETAGLATAPGFHAVESPVAVGRPAVAIPEFGYYAGPAAKITARQGNRQVQAALARWSSNPAIVIFWFPASTAPLTGLTAYGTTGHPLPPGHPAPASG